jgi:hypothetical protein
MKTEISSLTWPLACALFVLWGLIAVSVAIDTPEQSAPRDRTAILHADEGMLYYLDAEIMAKHFLPDPAARWSHLVTNLGTECEFVGNGIWFARGIVRLPSSSPVTELRWQAYFVPGEASPRYLKMGKLQFGDENEALRAASDNASPISGANRE